MKHNSVFLGLLLAVGIIGCGTKDDATEPPQDVEDGGDCTSTCLAPSNPCQSASCESGACVVSNLPQGTALPDPKKGDCKRSLCDDTGNMAEENDNTDTNNDGNACTVDQCEQGSATHKPRPVGTACNTQGGKVCSASGTCEQCNEGKDCSSGVCQNHVCTTAACTDNTKNGKETDVDCGGATCPACSDGQKCLGATDCKSLSCSGTCQVSSCTDSIKNGSESDTDCGGSCALCSPGKTCASHSDCSGGVCENGQCPCPSGQTSCGGACVDLPTDGKNCGACGHDCLGGACAGAKCGPVVLASGMANPDGIAVDSENVYWIDTTDKIGGLFKVKKTGGVPTQLATGLSFTSSSADMVLDTNFVYYSRPNEGTFARVGKNDGKSTDLAMVEYCCPETPALDANTLFFGEYQKISRVAKTGGKKTILFAGSNIDPFGMVADGNSLYWSNAKPSTIMKGDKTGGVASIIATDTDWCIGGLAIDSTSLYWGTCKGIGKMSKSGGTDILISLGNDHPRKLAVDDSHIYWTGPLAGPNRIPKSGGPIEAVGTDDEAHSIAVDAVAVYWTAQYPGRVMMRVK